MAIGPYCTSDIPSLASSLPPSPSPSPRLAPTCPGLRDLAARRRGNGGGAHSLSMLRLRVSELGGLLLLLQLLLELLLELLQGDSYPLLVLLEAGSVGGVVGGVIGRVVGGVVGRGLV